MSAFSVIFISFFLGHRTLKGPEDARRALSWSFFDLFPFGVGRRLLQKLTKPTLMQAQPLHLGSG